MASGIIIIDKPQGWTSQDVAARLRRVFGTRRVGHGGTLDPMATGVLPVMVGRATRGAAFLENARKQYMATLRLGLLTDTEDTTGTVLETRPVTVGREDVEAMFRRFLGRQMQVPPMYSAVKVDGKKLYTLARQGQHIERAPRPIEIYRLELVQVQDRDYTFLVDCSKGTYIRTLCGRSGPPWRRCAGHKPGPTALTMRYRWSAYWTWQKPAIRWNGCSGRWTPYFPTVQR